MSKIKVGIVTYHFSDNYGALMQAYSLRKWFLNKQISAEFLLYHPSYVEEGGAFDKPWRPSLWRKNLTILYMKLAYLKGRIFFNKAQRSGFESFRREHLGVVDSACRTTEELEGRVNDFTLLICGSDQIWNPSIQRGLDPVYFLEIPGTEHARKVAYAPSFGRANIEPCFLPELGRLLNGLDSISVRESSGVEIIKLSGIPPESVSVMPDPTILLGDFSSLLNEDVKSENTVFCYALRTDDVIRDVAETVSKQFGYSLHSARSSRQRWRDIGAGSSPSPVEWLRMLASAKFLVSNSFHGIALAIVLNRPFIAVALPGKRANMNERLVNLLELTGLSHRLVSSTNSEKIFELVETPIDWDSVNDKLLIIRAEAENYLSVQIDAAERGMY